jgi:hypothetical protein
MPSQGISGAPPRLSIEMEATPQLNQPVRQIVGVGYRHEHLGRLWETQAIHATMAL